MKIFNRSKMSLLVGALFMLIGVLVSSSTLIEYLVGTVTSVSSQLLFGVTLFRIVLAIFGLTIILLGNVPIWKSGKENGETQLNPQRRLNRAVLVAIIAVALALRLYNLGAGLWLDEILTDVLFAKNPFGSIITTFESENQHFLYSLLAHASFEIFGESAWSLRLPAALFGVGSIWALYLLGREVAGEREALLSASLLTLSYTHIWFSQNARGYSGLLFWTIISSWLLVRALRETKPRLWVFYAIAAALGIYTHITMLFVMGGQFLVYLMTLLARRKQIWTNRWAGFFIGFCLAALITLQLYALVLPQVMGSMGREQSVVGEWKNPIWTLFELVKGMQTSFTSSIFAIGAFVIFGVGLLNYARTRLEVILLLVIPPLIGAVAVIGLGHHLWPRFFFFAMGFAALVVIRGAMVLGERVTRLFRLPATLSVQTGTIMCTGLILVSALSVPPVYGPKQDYFGALQFVEASKAPGDIIVVTGLATFPYKDFYHTDWKEVDSVAALDVVRTGAKRTWLVYTFPTVLASVSPDIKVTIERDFQFIKEFDGTVGDGTVFVYRSDLPPSGQSAK